MGNVHDCHPETFMDVFNFILHLLTQLLVERPKGLIHKYEVWIENQRARDGNPLLLPT